MVSAAVVRIVATITTMIPTTTTMPIPSQLRVLMILVTTRIPTAILMIAWNILRVPRGLPVSSGDIRATTSAYGVSDVAAKPTMELPSVSHRTEAEEKKSVSKIAEDFSIPASSYTDFVSPYKQSSSASAPSSAGLDSLFTPSAAPSGSVSGSSDGANVGSAHGTSLAREIVVLKPASYEDASSIAQSVRAGKIVVLYLRQTDPALSKRVLDFSFGVASALTAQVDCLAEKTFVVLQGKELTLEEKHNLAKQGVLKS